MPPEPAHRQVTVLVADDSDLYRAGLVRYLGRVEEVALVGEAADGVEALRAIVRERPSVAVLDVRMPGMDGHEVIRALPDELDVAVLLLSAGPPPPLPEGRPCAFLPKTDSRATILERVLELARDAAQA